MTDSGMALMVQAAKLAPQDVGIRNAIAEAKALIAERDKEANDKLKANLKF
jgi:hypothetical protein